MSDYYCDHGAYGAANRFALDTPTWGVPQEGDGSAMAASTTASTAAVLLNGQPSATQTLSICGVTLTAIASGATGNQFNIGASLDATANNIAATINASTSTALSAAVLGSGTVALRNLVFARGPSGGAPSGTVQMMMRVGSANLNSNVNNQIVSTFGTAPTITQWNGGVGGCFGYLINEVAYGVSTSIAQCSYGALGGWFACTAAALTITDNIYIRTGTNKTITVTLAASASTQRTFTARLIFDSNTKWTGDADSGTLALTFAQGANAASLNLTTVSIGNFYSQCLRRGNFKITTGVGLGVVTLYTLVNSGGQVYIEGWNLVDTNSSSGKTLDLFGVGSALTSPSTLQYVNCDYVRTVSQATIPSLMAIAPANAWTRFLIDGCTFTYNISGTSDPGALFTTATPGSGTYNLISFKNCQWIANGYSGGLTLFPTGTPSWVNTTTVLIDIRFESCLGLKYPTAFGGIVSASLFNDQDLQNLYLNLGSNGFRFENKRGLVDWNPLDNPPVLTATLPDGATAWSLRTLWLANGAVATLTPYALPPARIYNRLANGTRTVGYEFLAPNANTITNQMLRMYVTYVDITGTPRTEWTSIVSASSASWSNATGFTAYKINLTTAYQIAINTEIIIRAELFASPSTGSNTYLYFDPNPSIA